MITPVILSGLKSVRNSEHHKVGQGGLEIHFICHLIKSLQCDETYTDKNDKLTVVEM